MTRKELETYIFDWYSFSFSPFAYRVAFFFCSSCIGACTRIYGAAEAPVSMMASCLHYVHIIHGGSFRKPRGSCRQKNCSFVFCINIHSFPELVLLFREMPTNSGQL